jgi:hypothetical protein
MHSEESTRQLFGQLVLAPALRQLAGCRRRQIQPQRYLAAFDSQILDRQRTNDRPRVGEPRAAGQSLDYTYFCVYVTLKT